MPAVPHTSGSRQVAGSEGVEPLPRSDRLPDSSSWVPSWLPNGISGLRILLVPVFWMVASSAVARQGEATGLVPLLIVAAIGGSDLLDGFLARRFQLVSRTGVVLDAVADRFAQFALTAFYVFVDPVLPMWFLGLLIARDLIIGLGTLLAVRMGLGEEIRHETHGRLASLVMFGLFLTVLLPVRGSAVAWLVAAATMAVAGSTLAYIALGLRIRLRSQRSDR